MSLQIQTLLLRTLILFIVLKEGSSNVILNRAHQRLKYSVDSKTISKKFNLAQEKRETGLKHDKYSRKRFVRSGLVDEGYRWPNARVPTVIDLEFSNEEFEIILKAINSISESTCINFDAWNPEMDDDLVLIVKGKLGSGCSSEVGRRKGLQKINLESDTYEGDWGGTCVDVGVIIHELIHTLGFYHEHSRKNRNSFIEINYANIPPDQLENFDVSDELTDFDLPYDFESIMHYGPFDFALDQNIRTIISKNGTISENFILSKFDVAKIRRMYKCDCNQDGMECRNGLCRPAWYCDKRPTVTSSTDPSTLKVEMEHSSGTIIKAESNVMIVIGIILVSLKINKLDIQMLLV